MPAKGQILTDPASGDSFEFLQTSAETNGSSVSVRSVLRTKGQIVPDHIHASQDETFEVIEGELTVKVDGKTSTLTAGNRITLLKNVPHNHYNGSGMDVVYIHTVSPALDFEHLIETLVGLKTDGRGKDGKFGLVQELVMLRYLDGKTYLADLPIGLQKVLMHTIAPIGRLLGYRAVYEKYSGFEK